MTHWSIPAAAGCGAVIAIAFVAIVMNWFAPFAGVLMFVAGVALWTLLCLALCMLGRYL